MIGISHLDQNNHPISSSYSLPTFFVKQYFKMFPFISIPI